MRLHVPFVRPGVLALTGAVLACRGLLACGSGSGGAAGVDAGHRDGGSDARLEAGGDAADSSACGSQATHPVTVTVVGKAHLVEATPYVEVDATLPAGCWSSVVATMTASGNCTGTVPPGQNWPTACDPYDRLAQVWLADKGKTPFFVLDAVTSFGGTATWSQDITDYYPLVVGSHTYHLEIDTYSDSTGMVTGTASSHDATVTIVLTPGTPPHDVLAAIPLLRQTVTGDGGADASPFVHAELSPPKGAASGRLDYYTSGHGANGPLMECDEFCSVVNDVSVDGVNLYSKAPNANCSDNCTHVPSAGSISCGGQTFDYYCQQNPEACPSSAVAPRSNWCPSQKIDPIPLPLPATALSGRHEVGVRLVGADGTWPIGLSAVFYR